MTSYERFAEVYDELMQDIPYDKYVEWIKKHAPSSQYPKLLDVGCGTGTLSLLFHKAGYMVSGVDLSEEMLSIANNRMKSAGVDIPFYAMSMDELEGFSNLDVVVIPIDSINYLYDEKAVVETLRRIFDVLCNGGQLFFDVHSLFKMDSIFLEGPFTYDDGNITYIWYTEQGEFEHSVYHQLTFFVKDESSCLFERFEEEHFQRTFSVETYVKWLKDVGFSEVVISSDWSDQYPTDESERIFIQAIK